MFLRTDKEMMRNHPYLRCNTNMKKVTRRLITKTTTIFIRQNGRKLKGQLPITAGSSSNGFHRVMFDLSVVDHVESNEDFVAPVDETDSHPTRDYETFDENLSSPKVVASIYSQINKTAHNNNIA